MSIKEIYKKYTNWVVIVLVCLLGLKSCQSCTRERRLEFNESKYECVIDSLNHTISNYKDWMRSKDDSIRMYQMEVKNLQDNNASLRSINKHFQSTNKTLISTNKELTTTINKDIE